jgi:hypothetical protein
MSFQGNQGFLEIPNASLRVSGNVHAEGIKLGVVELIPSYDLASVSNVGNTTTQTVQFTNPTTSLVASSNVDVKGVLNHTQVANVAQITSNSNVVMEYRRSKKIIKYPRVAMTSASSGGYVVQTSGNNATSNDGWKAFNSVGFNGQTNAGDHWITPDLYTHDSGAFEHASTAIYQPLGNGATGAGAWIAIKLPHKIKLTKLRVDNVSKAGFRDYTVHGRNGGGAIVGGTAWSSALLTVADEGSGYSIIGNYVFTETSHDITTNDYYEEFIIIITKKTPASSSLDNFLLMRELQFFGLPEYDPEAHGTDVVLHTTPNVPNTDWLEVYYDAKESSSYPGTGGAVVDLSGNGKNGTLNGDVGFDSEYKAFTFDEAGDYITLDTGKTGNYIFSVSLWFKSSGNSIETLFHMNGDYATNNTVWIYGSGTSLSIDFVDNDYSCDTGKEIADNMWHHASFVYNGNGESGRDIYLDGIHLGGSLVGSSAGGNLNLTSTSSISRIGALNHSSGIIHEFKGSIANFRLFNRALSGDEIWELYAYQKEYFGVSPDVVTLKAGRVGIGTSEPRAVLDVRGDIRGGCPVFFQAHATHPSTATTLNAVTNPIPFNTIVHNKGGGLQPSGVFTCPLAGYYYIVWWFMSNLQNQTVYTYLTINGSLELNGTPQSRIYGYSGATGDIHNQVVAGGTVYMNVGDELRFVFAGSTYMYISTTPYNSFTGFYISS